MYGICGSLLQWIEDFLSGRIATRQKLATALSEVAFIISGIVQGSCLGPVLFLLYINDLPDIFDDVVTLKLFADDVKLYSNIAAVSSNNQ